MDHNKRIFDNKLAASSVKLANVSWPSYRSTSRFPSDLPSYVIYSFRFFIRGCFSILLLIAPQANAAELIVVIESSRPPYQGASSRPSQASGC